MLAALEQGVKGGLWFSLMDKVYAPRALSASWQQVRSNRGSGGVDRETVQQFSRHAEKRLGSLSQSLRVGGYQPLPVRRVYLPKPDGSRRPLGIPAVCDRVVQGALRNVLEPIFEREFGEHSYGFRPGRGAKDALRRVDGLLREGCRYVVDADLKSYFDTIPHDRLMALVEGRVADGRVLSLIRAFLRQGVLDGMRTWTPVQGTPQGAVISPLLANIYLHSLDLLMRGAGYEMTRYADDFVVLCRTADEAERALTMIRGWVEQAGLQLHPHKTRIVDMNEPGGFDFLGYHFERSGRVPNRIDRRPRRVSLRKFKDAIRRKTKRANGHSLERIIADVNRTTRGWYEYFKHSHRFVFSGLDGWIRMRLRSILRKRIKLRGCGRGRDHHRWPNAYFAAHGLFTMRAAHALACQSL
ncbi:MAG: group II intron reverse transcriptase/maturase [Phycisphaerae bacterium]|nr:group II intron reverse transcriptase/maturase [Phycisphaerae bacterium]